MRLFFTVVIFNGTIITGPTLIYRDEVSRSAFVGNLFCSSSSDGASWHFPNGTAVGFSRGTDRFFQFQQRGSGLSLSHYLLGEELDSNNGLWTCRLNSSSNNGAIPVGIYQRGGTYYTILDLQYTHDSKGWCDSSLAKLIRTKVPTLSM